MNPLPRFLVTGFEPFGSAKVNPTERIVHGLQFALDDDPPFLLETMVLPVTSIASDLVIDRLSGEQQKLRPIDHVLHLGLHMKIEDIALERVAINLDDYRIPDNEGIQVVDRPIDPNGKNALFSTVPTREFEKILWEEEIPCHLSYSAGTYLCNHLLYTTLNHLERSGSSTTCGFIHVPPFDHMDLETMTRAVLRIMDVLRRPV
jgi:pyroglutamyl-peptidase